ncbi:OmpP1/FadL family transporter [Legionella sp. CNM-4043-24]|uniref:OmpP1/FadL family transporter n=1 Tax=Legionella sp. CNM-4043-24 TaxID=3421646 RepID=UPI00403AE4C2
MDETKAVIKACQSLVFAGFLLSSCSVNASFIESTIGAAVVNDATAAYFNPAALTLLKNTQIIALESFAESHGSFSGRTIRAGTGFTQTGIANSKSNYFLPSGYWGRPLSNTVSLGLAIVANSFNKNIEENSVLRYDQSGSRVHSVDLVPAVGVKVNDYLSLGAAINLTWADILLRPLTGFPELNIPDSQSRNDSRGGGVGGDVGMLIKPSSSTIMGLNYRSAITYRLNGKSVFEGSRDVVSRQYGFQFWTPARTVFSINHILSPKLGLTGTAQYLQWDIFKQITIRGIASEVGTQALILNATVPYHLHNAWLLTLGGQYRMTPEWVIRGAGTFSQSPGNPREQLSNGDTVIAGLSSGYTLGQNLSIDASYAHAFIQQQNIHISNARHRIDGVNTGVRDSVSLKLTFNLG